MKVIRTFHPVGQGAFYSERFYEDGRHEAKYNIVYDCGTSWGSIVKAKKVVTQAFNKEDVIDYLFISHLDYDHISLVLTLINQVRYVRRIVLPLVQIDDIDAGIALNRISNHDDTVEFLQMISDFVHGVGDNRLAQNDTMFFFVGENEEKGLPNAQLWGNGESKYVDRELEWELIPYNIKLQDRKEELIMELNKLLHDDKLMKKLDEYSSTLPSSGAGLYDQLKEPEFVKKVIASKELKNAIKLAYEKVTGGVNANSLLLYSGPASLDSGYKVRYCSDYGAFFRYRRPGCLYTGDANCELPEWMTQQKFNRVWESIGTIQLPHHGSLASFDIDANPINRFYVFPVSCGNTNSYGHPSGKVLAYLMANNCMPRIVTESESTIYMQQIEKI